MLTEVLSELRKNRGNILCLDRSVVSLHALPPRHTQERSRLLVQLSSQEPFADLRQLLIRDDLLNDRCNSLPGNIILGRGVAERHDGRGEGSRVIGAVEGDGGDILASAESKSPWVFQMLIKTCSSGAAMLVPL